MNSLRVMQVSKAMVLVTLLLPTLALAANEVATFESIYKPSTAIYWWLAAIAALITGAVVVMTGGTTSPIVIAVGTWIGGLSGLSGAAATNAGLALLGGGSIVSGGFGVIGGAALVAAALSFGTDVVLDYTVGKAVQTYEYAKFAEASKGMTTLPLPENTSGPKSYKAGLDLLKLVDRNKPPSSSENNQVIQEAIKAIGAVDEGTLSRRNLARKESLLALLHFMSNHYNDARAHARAAQEAALTANVRATLPTFIIAASSLYDKTFDFDAATALLQQSIDGEPDNPITPVLFSIYLDRMMYRFNDGYLDSKSLDKIHVLSKSLQLDDRKAPIQVAIMSRYFIRLKAEQQRIGSLTGTINTAIKDDEKTLVAVRKSLAEYVALLRGAREATQQLAKDIDARTNRDKSIFESVWEFARRLVGKDSRKVEREFQGQIGGFETLLRSYSEDQARLAGLVEELANYQASRKAATLPEPQSVTTAEPSASNWILWLLLAAAVVVGGVLVRRRIVAIRQSSKRINPV